MSNIEALLEVMRRLRDPRGGCPWDLEQSFASIAPYTIEEAYEVADAIARDDSNDLVDELGDLLFQVVFHAQMAAEVARFDFSDVVRGIVEKMIRRHPHVFGDHVFGDHVFGGAPGENSPGEHSPGENSLGESKDAGAISTGQVARSWEAIKAQERASKTASGDEDEDPSRMSGIAHGLPAMRRAWKIQKRAAGVGFDWTRGEQVLDKLREELDELTEVVDHGPGFQGHNVDLNAGQGEGREGRAMHRESLEHELGDLLFSSVNFARHFALDPEMCLRKANIRFERRFRAMESMAHEAGSSLEGESPQALEQRWAAAKALGEGALGEGAQATREYPPDPGGQNPASPLAKPLAKTLGSSDPDPELPHD